MAAAGRYTCLRRRSQQLARRLFIDAGPIGRETRHRPVEAKPVSCHSIYVATIPSPNLQRRISSFPPLQAVCACVLLVCTSRESFRESWLDSYFVGGPVQSWAGSFFWAAWVTSARGRGGRPDSQTAEDSLALAGFEAVASFRF